MHNIVFAITFQYFILQGSQLVNELIDIYGLEVVQAYMGHIQNNAEVAVREMLKSFGNKFIKNNGRNSVTAVDYLDDGSRIELKLEIDVEKGEAIFDFTLVYIIIFLLVKSISTTLHKIQ